MWPFTDLRNDRAIYSDAGPSMMLLQRSERDGCKKIRSNLSGKRPQIDQEHCRKMLQTKAGGRISQWNPIRDRPSSKVSPL